MVRELGIVTSIAEVRLEVTLMDRLRIGVIGLGWFGEIHCDTIIGIPNLELAALCTRTPERLKQLAGKYSVHKAFRDYRELIADPSIDAVSIVTMARHSRA